MTLRYDISSLPQTSQPQIIRKLGATSDQSLFLPKLITLRTQHNSWQIPRLLFTVHQWADSNISTLSRVYHGIQQSVVYCLIHWFSKCSARETSGIRELSVYLLKYWLG